MSIRAVSAPDLDKAILSVSSQHSLDGVLEQAVRGVRALSGAVAAAIGLFDDCGGLRHVFSDGVPEDALTALAASDASSNGVFKAPLVAGSRRLGILVAEPGPTGLDDERRELLDRLAAHVAVAVDNADLFEQQEVERQRATISSLRDRRRLDEVVRHLPIGIAILDRDLRYLFCNDAMAAFHGLFACDLTGRSAREAHPVATKAMERELRAALALRPQEIREAPYHLPHEPDDAPFHYANLHILPLPEESGRTEGIVLIASDATPSVEARQRLEELAALAGTRAAEFGGVLENIGDPILVVDERGNTKLANPAMERLARAAGVRTPKGLLRSLANRMRQPDGRPVRPETSPLARALRGEHVRGEELVLPLPDGTRLWLAADARPFYGPRGQLLGAVSIVRDVSAGKKHERMRDEFLSLVAHQLRTPLTVIYGVARKLTRNHQPISSELRDELLLDMFEEADRLRELIEDLLLLGQAQTRMEYRAEPLRPEQAVGEAVEAARRFAPAQRVGLVLQPDLPIMMADPSLLTQVLRTLITNAGRYSPAGSEIEVRVADEPQAVRISVLDRGIGLEEEDPELLFEPFYRARGALSQPGLGLGLTIARRLVDVQGGTLSAERREGGGSIFSLTLPIAEPVGD